MYSKYISTERERERERERENIAVKFTESISG